MTNQPIGNKALALAVTPSIKLHKNQARLYEFIVSKYKTGDTITLNDVVKQYSEYGNRNIDSHGRPCGYHYNWKERHYNLAPLDESELPSWALQWFIRNLGMFVVKGLLTAIPTMELSQIEVLASPT